MDFNINVIHFICRTDVVCKFCELGHLEAGSGEIIEVKCEGENANVHEECLIWKKKQFNYIPSEESTLDFNIQCNICTKIGSVLKCDKCSKSAHIKCAENSLWHLNISNFETFCDACNQ